MCLGKEMVKTTQLTQKQILEQMGIESWVPREAGELMSVQPQNTEQTPSNSEQKSCASMDTLKSVVSQCQRCGLHATRKQTVFGVGSLTADLMLIGEAPGFYEDKQGEPFVGRAGQLLTQMLLAIGLSRDKVFIANILKCRPPNNRDPSNDEVAQCTPYLIQQIEFIQPKLIVALGRIAGQFLIEEKQTLSRMRGRVFQYKATQTPLIVTYHPAYLLRNPRDKRKSWQDLQVIQQKLQVNKADRP